MSYNAIYQQFLRWKSKAQIYMEQNFPNFLEFTKAYSRDYKERNQWIVFILMNMLYKGEKQCRYFCYICNSEITSFITFCDQIKFEIKHEISILNKNLARKQNLFFFMTIFIFYDPFHGYTIYWLFIFQYLLFKFNNNFSWKGIWNLSTNFHIDQQFRKEN